MAEVLTISHLTARYGSREVLHDVSFEVTRGRIVALIGPSGCGKSTLLRCINRTLELEPGASWQGQVQLDGHDLGELAADDARTLIGLVAQQPCPFPFSVFKNLAYAPRYSGVRKRVQLEQIAREALAEVGLLDELDGDLGRHALALSGGQQQRLCIARALTAQPQVLLLDEPCSALDVASTADVEAALAAIKQTRPVLLVTHNLAQAERIADTVICLDQGQVTWQGPAAELFDQKGAGKTVLDQLYHALG